MPRIPPPGPSFLRVHEVVLGERRLRAGMDRPTEIEGWWLAVFWVADADGIVTCRAAAPAAGPPPDPPLARLGPLLSGGLSGFVLEDEAGEPPGEQRAEPREWRIRRRSGCGGRRPARHDPVGIGDPEDGEPPALDLGGTIHAGPTALVAEHDLVLAQVR